MLVFNDDSIDTDCWGYELSCAETALAHLWDSKGRCGGIPGTNIIAATTTTRTNVTLSSTFRIGITFAMVTEYMCSLCSWYKILVNFKQTTGFSRWLKGLFVTQQHVLCFILIAKLSNSLLPIRRHFMHASMYTAFESFRVDWNTWLLCWHVNNEFFHLISKNAGKCWDRNVEGYVRSHTIRVEHW